MKSTFKYPTDMVAKCQILVKNELDQAVCLINDSEKLTHLLYLKSFRTEACQKFREHRCIYHKPYTCFNWHFPNQRRRRPFRLKNGQFNYSSDVYCNHYDENSGYCPIGDSCFYLHKNAGDTERRYHLRYFRTLICNNELDTSGKCVRNGRHCAFAHGAEDLRQPMYDIRELAKAAEYNMNLPAILEKERILSEDPNWNNLQFVLLKYKTDLCKRNSRMCRQGYACPYFHNSKDKRRNPLINKYRSTPCPIVKFNEEWGDPLLCEMEDDCVYCHTRTEQQFHPEIYKSTKCNDMLHLGYCPRGPFCAFAHLDSEMNFGRECLYVDEMERRVVAQQLSLESFVVDSRSETVPKDTLLCSTVWGDAAKEGGSNGGGLVSCIGGSLFDCDTPPRFRRTTLLSYVENVSSCAVSSSSFPPFDDDLDLKDVMQSFTLADHDVAFDKGVEEKDEHGLVLNGIQENSVINFDISSMNGSVSEVRGIPLFPVTVGVENVGLSTLSERRVFSDRTNSEKHGNPEAVLFSAFHKRSFSATSFEFVTSSNVI